MTWLNVFSDLWKSIKKTCFFEDQTASETKELSRPVHWAVRLWTAFTMFVCVDDCVYAGGPVHCSVIHVHICVYMSLCVCVGPHFLLVLQKNRFLSVEHWLFILETATHVQTCLSLPGSVIVKPIWLPELSLWFAPCQLYFQGLIVDN